MLVQVRIRAIFATSPSKIYNQAVERVCLLSNSAQNQKSVPQQPSKPHNLIVLGPDSYILKFLYIEIGNFAIGFYHERLVRLDHHAPRAIHG